MMIGQKNRRVTLARATTTTDGGGDIVTAYATVATGVPASVEPLRGNELFTAQQVASEVTHRIRIRYAAKWSDLTAKDRVTLASRNFDVLSVLNVNERNRELEIMAKEHIGY